MIGGRHVAVLFTLLVAPAAGCNDLNTPIYFDSPTPVLEVAGLDAMGNPGRAENGMTLRFRNPTSTERKALNMQASALGFKVPWIQRAHVHLELSYQVKNLDTTDGTFAIGIDGADEYTKYDENIVAMTLQQGNDNPPVYIPLIPVTPQLLAAGQTVSGLVREDDFNEAELDLDAIGRWMAPFNAVLINNSQVNPIGLSMVPANVVLPALLEIDVSFSASTHMQCNYVVRVRDDDDQLLHDTTNTLFSPTPTLFQPPAMTDTN